MAKPELLTILQTRLFLHQITDEDALARLLNTQIIPAYIGFDATADSLHVGSLTQIMLLRWLQKMGHKPIILMGGGSSMIGDPSGKDRQRQMLTPTEISANIVTLQKIFAKYLHFGTKDNDAIIVNNADWLLELNYIDLLRTIGPHFSVNRMLGFESVRLRLEREQPLSFLEFNYMVLQAYDFMFLARDYGCRLQMGGSDQWGNIVSGIDLTRKMANIEVFGLTSPLLTTASGEKMGKSAKGAIWLNRDKCSEFDFWQYWRNSHDGDVGKFLRLFTELPLDEIARLEKLEGAEMNHAKIILANQITALCHNPSAANQAEQIAQKLFSQGTTDSNMASYTVTKTELEIGIKLFQLLHLSGLTTNTSEARRLIKGGGARINNEKIADENHIITLDSFKNNEFKLSSGKKNHILINLE